MTYMGETKVLTVCEDTCILEAALKVRRFSIGQYLREVDLDQSGNDGSRIEECLEESERGEKELLLMHWKVRQRDTSGPDIAPQVLTSPSPLLNLYHLHTRNGTCRAPAAMEFAPPVQAVSSPCQAPRR